MLPSVDHTPGEAQHTYRRERETCIVREGQKELGFEPPPPRIAIVSLSLPVPRLPTNLAADFSCPVPDFCCTGEARVRGSNGSACNPGTGCGTGPILPFVRRRYHTRHLSQPIDEDTPKAWSWGLAPAGQDCHSDNNNDDDDDDDDDNNNNNNNIQGLTWGRQKGWGSHF